jgi:uncharacterized protein YecT (DUF1311 family)
MKLIVAVIISIPCRYIFQRQLCAVVIWLVVAVAGPWPSYAASFRLISEPSDNLNECHLLVKGAIEIGDNDRLSTALGEREGGKGTPIIACLDSTGGNFSEAIEIGKTFIRRAVKTKILADESCLSACAIVFMTGMTYSTMGGQVGRSMHVTSRLGFHAPTPELIAGQTFDGDDLQAAYAAAIEAVGRELLSIAQHRGRASSITLIKPTLLNEMLIVRGGDFFYIDTIRKAAEFGIELDGVPERTVFQIDDAMDACENAIAYAEDSSLADLFFRGRLDKIEKKIEQNRTEYNITVHHGYGTYCNVTRWRKEWDDSMGLKIQVNTGSNDNNVYLPGIFLLPGDTPLKALAAQDYQGPSYDGATWCSKSKRPSESAICNSRNLRKFDAHIEKAYQDKMSDASGEKRAEWKASQIDWLKERNKCAGDYACLYKAYRSRLDELNEEYSVDWKSVR